MRDTSGSTAKEETLMPWWGWLVVGLCAGLALGAFVVWSMWIGFSETQDNGRGS